MTGSISRGRATGEMYGKLVLAVLAKYGLRSRQEGALFGGRHR
jgi:hypothetical protein